MNFTFSKIKYNAILGNLNYHDFYCYNFFATNSSTSTTFQPYYRFNNLARLFLPLLCGPTMAKLNYDGMDGL